MNEDCGCCEGLEELTPAAVANRPGLDALAYRVGTHAAFLETMKARLSNHELAAEDFDEQGHARKPARRPLAALTTRAGEDASIAMLDAWATVADVLTFYQERIANEGFLRTATERRSIVELARLIGYQLPNGVASSVYLAFTLEAGTEQEIPAGTRAASVPLPGELMQPFETSAPLAARAAWNTLPPRRTRPQKDPGPPYLYLKGTATNLSKGDPLLLVNPGRVVYRVLEVEADTAADRTRVKLIPWVRATELPSSPPSSEPPSVLERLNETVTKALDRIDPNDIDPNLKTAIAGGQLLKRVQDHLTSQTAGEILRLLEEETLPELQRLAAQPAVQRSPNLRTWLREMIEEFEDIVGTLATLPPDEQIELGELFDESDLFKVPETLGGEDPNKEGARGVPTIELVGSIAAQLIKPASQQPASNLDLERKVEQSFSAISDTAPRLLTTFNSALKQNLYRAIENAPVTEQPTVEVYALRTKAKLFGSTAPKQTRIETTRGDANTPGAPDTTTTTTLIEWTPDAEEADNLLFLDNAYDKILPGGYVVVQRPELSSAGLRVFIDIDASVSARAAYGVSADTTRILLDGDWWFPHGKPASGGNPTQPPEKFEVVRGTVVFAQSERLAMAEEPITDDICADPNEPAQRIELDGVYDGLEPGRWLIITGERADVGIEGEPPAPQSKPEAGRDTAPSASGTDTSTTTPNANALVGAAPGGVAPPPVSVPAINATEVIMLGGVELGYDPSLPGDRIHTTIVLAEKLAYCYKRDTVIIYGNVTKATHGETREEVLGSGDGSRAMQSFALRQSPLTYVSAATPSGVESTLTVRVNDVRWRETDSLAGLAPQDHKYVTRTDDESKTTVVFGNGERGARLPSGVENVRAVYRTGIGRPGNVKAGQITLLATKPLYVSKVLNPLASTGGADREDRDHARRNAPLSVMSLDRLISVRDYEDFARTFAGIGKVSAVHLSDGQAQVVHLTVAGADDIPLTPDSDLLKNLRLALLKFGDPYLPLMIDVRALRLLVIAAGVSLDPDYLWSAVEPKIRSALLDRFSFDRRALGQDVYLSEVIGTIQSVPGVAYVDVDTFDVLDEDLTSADLESISRRSKPRQRIPVRLAEPDRYAHGPYVKPAQIALLSPAVPETLILKEL